MERGKKCFRKKHRMANSIFSWLLTFAIVVSSASTAPGFVITSLAAENEAGESKNVYTSEEDGIVGSDVADDNTGADDGDTGDGTTSDDDQNGDEGAGTNDGAASDDSGTGDNAAPGDSDDNGSGAGDDASSDESENTDDETDMGDIGDEPEEDDVFLDGEEDDSKVEDPDEVAEEEQERGSGNGARSDSVEITLHVRNDLNWNQVYVYSFVGANKTEIAGGWPGTELTEEKGWYTTSLSTETMDEFCYIINNNNGAQTPDTYVTFPMGMTTYELWTWVEEKGQGSYETVYSLSSVESPEVNGSKVTFRYKNDWASSVYLAGTMNGWSASADEMTREDGVFTWEDSLEHGEYQYKFIVNYAASSDWITDPSNPLYAEEKNDDGTVKNTNSLVYVPGDTEYTYIVHYYDPDNADQAVTTPDLYVWELGIEYAKTDNAYTYESADTDNGIKWLTTTFSVPYRNLGIIGRQTAGSWDGGKDIDRFYQLAGSDSTGAELWYIYGQGIYDKKPMFGDVEKVEAALYYDSMDYTRNNVLSLTVNGSEDGGSLVSEAYVDASKLGMSNQLKIDPELMEISLSVTEDTEPGSYDLPITVIGNNGSKVTDKVTVEVTAKPSEEDDFDWDEAVIYFMVTDRFFDGNESNNAANGSETFGTNAGLYHGGDFAGVTAKLDYLQELGVNTIWITPIVENITGVTVGDGTGDVPFNAAYHGYWASDFTELNPALGTDAEFQALIDGAHAKGMKIMVDVVVNHAGYGAEANFAGMLRETVADQNDYVHGGGQANLPDFLTENPKVRDQIIDWQVEWLEKGIDYFRVDTVKHVDNTTWMAFKNELTKANPKFKMIGEYFDAGYASNNGGTLGSGQMDSLLDFNFNDWATDFVKGDISGVEQKLAERNAALNNTYLTGQFLSSHDENGFKWNLKKSGMTDAAADAATLVAATLQITAKGQPVIYYGEEIGQTGENNYPYQTNRYDFDWKEAESGSNKTYAHYKKMLGIREQYSEVFAKGDRKVVAGSNSDGFDVISRSYNGETVYVGMNIGSDAKEIKISVDGNGITEYTDLYGKQVYQVAEDSTVTVTIPAAADGGTIVLAAGGYADVLVAPELTIAKGNDVTGKVSALPTQLTHVAEDGSKTSVEVTYSMEAVEGVTLDGEGCKITVNQAFTGNEITLKATATDEPELSVTFTVKVVEDKNEITLRLHYTRKNSDYTGWNVWAWADGMEGARYDFDATGENGEKVATFILKGREIRYFNYIIRRSVTGNEWIEKDLEDDQKIDLTDVLSGTVDYYVESGVSGGKRVLGDDVLLGAKVLSATYNSTNKTIKVVTGMPVVGKTDGVFTLKSEDGKAIQVTGVQGSKTEYTLSLSVDLSLAKKYLLGFDGYEYQVAMPTDYSTQEFEEQYTYSGNDLGASWSKDKTTFKVWAPTADEVKVNLYKSGTKGTNDLIESINMTKGEKGVWSAEKTGDLNGTYYTYTAVQGDVSTEACDPYARTTGVNGDRAMVIDLDSTDPAGWANDSGPNQGMSYNDSVIYELHVRDFSIDESSGISADNKGKFLGLTEKGTTNTTGQTTGLDYLVDLGVTHIHLLPSYDYGSVDETKLDEAQYNWGYDPVNYNVPEGSYSTDPYDGETRVKEMKQMVKTLHDNNINVIMDVVYNHVYDADEFCFNQLVPQYFSRTNEDGSYSNASGCGNDTASERAMVRKYIVDSVNYWADEYHIDGFRFDLVGLLDADTINEVVKTVHQKHPDAVFYGEGWTMNSAVSKPNITMATQANSAKTPNFAYFSDTIRDAIKGDNFNVKNTGFVNGATGLEQTIADCFTAATWWCKSPTQTVNYASCHDNYTLWDKISVSRSDASEKDRIRMNNLAAAIYMTAEGIPLIHAGEEILRTKPSLDPENEHGVEHNSYNLPDSVNSIKWSDLNKEEYRNVRDYYKGLIEFRKNHAALRLTSAADVKANVSYRWITNEVVMFVIGGNDTIEDEVSDGIVVIFNATNSEQSINLYNNYGIAEGTWNVCINDKKAGIETLASVTDGQVKVAPISAMVLVKGETEDQDSVYDKNDPVKRKLQALKELIADYDKLEQGNYTDESWKTFTDALTAAKTTAGKSGVTAEEIDSVMEALETAYDGLTEGTTDPVDTSVLEGLVEEYSKITEKGDYTDESWAAFQKALEEAERVLADANATQEDVDQAKEDLQKAYDELKVPEGSVDTGKLKALIEKCSGLTEQEKYTTESWEKFTDALEAAKTVLAKTDATQDEINQAQKELQAAYDGLTEVTTDPVDTSVLEGLVEEYSKITEKGDYTDESWTAFQDALKEAERVLADANATQEDVKQAQENLQKTYDELKVPEGSVDTGKLRALIEQCSALTEQGNYTDESWETFTKALEAAKTVLAKTDATQEEINQAQKDLKAAYDGLTEGTTDPVVNTGELKDLVEKYSKITEQGDYTDESWAAFQKALKEAKETVAKENVTQAEVDSAKEALEEAYKGLTTDPTPARTGLWAEWTDEWAELLSNDNTITYTGKAIKPTVMVYDGETLLTNKSYSVSYKNNTKVGDASVIIKGKGNYTGSYTMNFKIAYVDLENDSDVSIADLYVAASKNDKPVSVKPVVTWKGKKVNAKMYEVELPDKAEEGAEVIPYVTPGTYNVVVKAKENNGIYTGQKEIKITLANTADNTKVLMSAVKVKFNFKSKQWTAVEGGVTLDTNDIKVTYKNEDLISGKDYELTYENNDRIGTATVIITGTGTPENNEKYVGELRKTFKIVGTAIKAADVELELGTEPIVYNGEKHEPKVKITGLNKDSDYTVAYQNNVNAGKKATVIITGINGCSGTVKKTFTIAAHDVNQKDVSIVVNENKTAAYEKGGSKPSVKVTFGGRTLVPGTDYTVSYAKNTKVTEGATAEARITGKGNFTQKKTVTFAIGTQSLAELKATAADQTSAKKWNKVNPVITDKNGKTLKKGTDYEKDLTYVLCDADGQQVTDTTTTPPAAGMRVKVTAKGKGNYEGEITAECRIIDSKQSIAKARITIKNAPIYTGEEIELEKSNITLEVKDGTVWKPLTDDEYEIVGYSNNINKGKGAKVTIHGLAPYGGTKTFKFEIKAQSIEGMSWAEKIASMFEMIFN